MPRQPDHRPIGPELAAIWQSSKDAIGHGNTVAQVGWYQWKESLRAAVARFLLTAAAVITALAAAVTMAVWATSHLLVEISAALGGGLQGCISAIAIVLGAASLLGLIYLFVRSQARTRRLTEKLKPQSANQDAPSAELAELRRIRQQALVDLQADKAQISKRAGAILQQHPIAALSTSAATGLVVTRLLMRMPKTLRRSAIGALRLTSSAGIASLFRSPFGAGEARRTNEESSRQQAS